MLAVVLLLIAANVFVVWSIRRGLDPLRKFTEMVATISPANWNFQSSQESELANELSPMAHSIEGLLARIKESLRRQNDFTSDVAHELKTSVAILKSSLQSLLQRPRTQREYQIGLEEVLEDCSRLEDLLEKMLRLARIEQASESGARRNLAMTDVNATCEAALARIRKMAEQRNVAIEFDASDTLILSADPGDLELIWTNILENAVQFGPPGSVVTMRLLKNVNSMAQISIFDSGPGFSPVEIPYLFERFRGGEHPTARSTGGFGLGLAICKAVVDSYGGTIEAINLPGGGAELRVELPLSRTE